MFADVIRMQTAAKLRQALTSIQPWRRVCWYVLGSCVLALRLPSTASSALPTEGLQGAQGLIMNGVGRALLRMLASMARQLLLVTTGSKLTRSGRCKGGTSLVDLSESPNTLVWL
jgi:hypothetical protein